MTPRQPDSVARLVQPSVVSIDPSWGRNIESVSVTNLAGDNFVNGATVRLTAQWKPDIMAADVSVASSSRITCTFDLRKAPSGRRDLVVTNPGGKSSTLLRDAVRRGDGRTIFFARPPALHPLE